MKLYRKLINPFGEIRYIYPFNEDTAEELINKLEIVYKISKTFGEWEDNLKEIGITKEFWENISKENRKQYLIADIKERKSFYYYVDTDDEDTWIAVDLKQGDYFEFTENGKYGDNWSEKEIELYFRKLSLSDKVKRLKENKFIIASIINLSTIVNTNYDNIIKDILENYNITELEYPEKLEKINIQGIENYKNIDWKDYNWLVVIVDVKEKYNLIHHTQLYKDLEKLEIERKKDIQEKILKEVEKCQK